MKPLLKQAEQNVVNRAKAYNDALEFVDALANFGNRACREHVGKPKFFEGLSMIRTAIRAEQSEAIRECFYCSVSGAMKPLNTPVNCSRRFLAENIRF